MVETDPSLFVRLLLQHQNDLLGYILPLVGCLDDAQDVLQETATALWQKFDRYDPGRPLIARAGAATRRRPRRRPGPSPR